MEFNTSMCFVMLCAQEEAANMKNKTIRIEHIFLGFIKLSEIWAADFAPTSEHIEQIDDDIISVKAQLFDLGIELRKVRSYLRDAIQKQGLPESNDELKAALETADELATSRGEEKISAALMLEAVLNHPSPLLLGITNLKEIDTNAPSKPLILWYEQPDENKPEEKVYAKDISSQLDTIYTFTGYPKTGKTILPAQVAEVLAIPYRYFNVN